VRGVNKDRYRPIVVSLSQRSSITDDETKGDYWADRIRELEVEVIQLPRKRHKEFSRLIKLIKIFRQKKPYIIHTYLHSANSYGRIAALFANIAIIIASERSSYEIGKDKKRYEIYIDKLLAFFTSGIICNSHNTSKSLIERYSFNRDKVFTVHNGIKIDSFNKNSDSNNEKKLGLKIIGNVAHLTRPKNHKIFLEAVKIILQRYKGNNLEILVVGKGPLENDLKTYAYELGISKKVLFTGSRDDVPTLLQKMDIFVSSSDYEGLSNAIMEAMAAGLPCVVTDVGGNSELVVDGETGYIVPPNDPDALATKILYLLNDNSLVKKFGYAGQEVMRKEFSLGRMVRKTEKIYEELVRLQCK